jgi:hypothetical protein
MLGAAGERAGIGHQTSLRAGDASRALSNFLSGWTADTILKESATEKEMTWRDVVHGTIAMQAVRLLSVLSEDCPVYMARDFTLPDGETLKPSWALGQYLVETGRQTQPDADTTAAA